MDAYNPSSIRDRMQLILQWHQTDAYKALCFQQQQQYDTLLKECLPYFENINEAPNADAAYIEYAVKGSMHRGVYCPSPVQELLIGNISRGRVLKRVTVASKISHIFGFDQEKNLQFVQKIWNGKIVYTEHIFREGDKVLGITIDDSGHLSAISEEQYADGRIQKYIYAQMLPCVEEITCFRMQTETYQYDEQGLLRCLSTAYDPWQSALHENGLYEFDRREGLLHSYTAKDLIWMQIDPGNSPVLTYTSRVPVKAKFYEDQ